MALVTFRDVSLRFRGPPLLDRANLQIERGERVCLLGRNGAGKTSLMRLIHGELEPDDGEIVRSGDVETALLAQQVPQSLAGTIFDQVAGGLAKHGALLAEYHHVSQRLAVEGGAALAAQLDRIGHALEIDGGWQLEQQVQTVLSRMNLDPGADVATLSAGQKRRVLFARAVVAEPDVLLLDEPTNHLDIDAITWLEEFLARWDAALVFVTHDRMFLKRLATRIVELDRAKLTSWSCDYETFLRRKEAALDAEAQGRALFDKQLAKEEAWIRQGIKARRTRNEGRVRALAKMRESRRQRREQPGAARIQLQQAERSGRLVIKASGVSHDYGKGPVIRDFSTTIIRGDKIGVIGPNGSGKTTLLRILLGQLSPQEGTVRHGTNLEVAYFDQLHAQLDEERPVRENLGAGGDTVTVNGKKRHVLGYLAEFLFTAEQAAAPAARLSGGERNRLLLARVFARPSNVLVLDEPTNDLDIETLELLEELLLEYAGTLLLVSHDREFLNNLVTSTIVLEGQGRVKEYAGGYDDWLAQRKPDEPDEPVKKPRSAGKTRPPRERSRRLTYGEKRELESLPARIESLEAEIARLHQAMAEPSFYQKDRREITEATARLESLQKELTETYQRWERLEALEG